MILIRVTSESLGCLESGTNPGCTNTYQDGFGRKNLEETDSDGGRTRTIYSARYLRKRRSVRPQQCSLLQLNFNHYNINDAIMNNSGDIYESLSVLPKHTAILVGKLGYRARIRSEKCGSFKELLKVPWRKKIFSFQ